MNPGLLILVSLALICVGLWRFHCHCRIREERDIVYACTECGQSLAYDRRTVDTVIRSCPAGHLDYRVVADRCTTCGGHLAYDGEYPGTTPDTFQRNKVCTGRCGTALSFTMRRRIAHPSLIGEVARQDAAV